MQHAYLLAKIGFDTAETEPSKVIFVYFDIPQIPTSSYNIITYNNISRSPYSTAREPLENAGAAVGVPVRGDHRVHHERRADGALEGVGEGGEAAARVLCGGPVGGVRRATHRTNAS